MLKPGWMVNAVLLAGVVALGLYVYLRPRVDEAPRHKLSTLAPSAVSRAVIEPSGGQPIALAKRNDAWFLVRPFEARADRSQVERMLELLSAQAKEKLTATDLARFDLDRPALVVTLEDERLAFGTKNPLTQEQYVLSGDGVYLLASFYASLVPQDPQRLLTHALFLDSERPVAFTLPSFRIELKDAKWVLSPADQDAPSQDDLNQWVDGWRFASSLLTRPASSGKALTQSISVRLSDGRTLKLGILQRAPELVLVRPDEKLQFHFSGELAKRLLSRPAASALSSDSAASAVQVQ